MPNLPEDSKPDPKASSTNNLEDSLLVKVVGVYTLYREKKKQRGSLRSVCVQFCEKWIEYLKAITRLVWEVYTLAPVLFLLSVLGQLVQSTEDLILLHYETRIMRIIEIGISKGTVDTNAVVQAVGARILCVVGIKVLYILRSYAWSAVFNQEFFSTLTITCSVVGKLGLDMSMLAGNLKDDNISAGSVWYTVEALLSTTCRLFGLLSQLGFVYHLGRSSNYGTLFIFLCLAKPLLSRRFIFRMYAEPRIVETTNPHFIRMKSLEALAEKQFRSDIMSGNIYRKAQAALGDTPIIEPHMVLYTLGEESFMQAFFEAADDLPMVFCAALVIINPSKTSLSTIFSLRQSANSLKTSFFRMFYEISNLESKADVAVQLYEMEKKLAQTAVKDGELVYGVPEFETESKDVEKSVSRGMGIEVRDVSFSYPGGEANAKALDNASFSIAPGQLVVIVGANGSGKSTFIKLLSRLYNASSGEILVDGVDITKYKLGSIRQAMAMLTQDHHLYPLSIKENIGLGFAERMYDDEMVMDAAKKGGADTVVKRLAERMDTVLDPKGFQTAYKVLPTDKTALGEKLKSLKKTVDVSGGEKQRLVAQVARTFMRFNSGKVNLVAVDEPSSALDPEAELELFNNIRNMREGKTVIFVTHRFGHLTKHADLILCMDGGRVIESGTHTELMTMEGQYFKMYNIQAQAFEPKQEKMQ
ncbi:hypothetical protein D9758_002928 [Tetrapyrgos nigripes]|uniref:ABC transporter domain-containing protein n=1 Tax=Tetrapyrgos nigripes TaxID=182062 RepID=A0A8H5GQA5_9AGAR|nr:hypothetical protein D9758_002928 [Tetrapyrgos nigripes]